MKPIIEQLKTKNTAAEIFARLYHQPFSIFLDSGTSHQNLGRYSFIFTDPFMVLKSHNMDCIVIKDGKVIDREKVNPWKKLQELMTSFQRPHHPKLPSMASGGVAGYFSYDLGRYLETIPCQAKDDYNLPELYLCFYDTSIIVDHLNGEKYVVSAGQPQDSVRQIRYRLNSLKEKILSAPPKIPIKQTKDKINNTTINTHFTRDTYCQAVKTVKNYISTGDICQVNLSQRMESYIDEDPFYLYWRLRHINPAPFAAYLHFPEVTIASASPERFLKVKNRQVQTRPIKGTRPRGKTPDIDRAMKKELLNSEKDRAELEMITNLECSDISKVCHPDSVRVPKLFELETYATVHHLVSTVEGILEKKYDTVDLLKACFPGGSITGTPKIRAMEIIEELEPVRRGIYTGSIGYLGFDGTADLSIVIRTFIIKNNKVYFQVGGGIVADSSPEAEYQETLDKAKALLTSIGAYPRR